LAARIFQSIAFAVIITEDKEVETRS